MARSKAEAEVSSKLVEGLTGPVLLELTDQMLKRGVAKFAIGAVVVEFAPAAVGTELAAQRTAAERQTVQEAGGLAQIRKAAAEQAATERHGKAVASA